MLKLDQMLVILSLVLGVLALTMPALAGPGVIGNQFPDVTWHRPA